MALAEARSRTSVGAATGQRAVAEMLTESGGTNASGSIKDIRLDLSGEYLDLFANVNDLRCLARVAGIVLDDVNAQKIKAEQTGDYVVLRLLPEQEENLCWVINQLIDVARNAGANLEKLESLLTDHRVLVDDRKSKGARS